jgi:hypothetical protein
MLKCRSYFSLLPGCEFLGCRLNNGVTASNNVLYRAYDEQCDPYKGGVTYINPRPASYVEVFSSIHVMDLER